MGEDSLEVKVKTDHGQEVTFTLPFLYEFDSDKRLVSIKVYEKTWHREEPKERRKMKRVGTTMDGASLIEVSKNEYNALVSLQESVSIAPSSPSLLEDTDSFEATDLAPTFRAIRAWTEAKFKLNALRHLLTAMEEELMSEDNDGWPE